MLNAGDIKLIDAKEQMVMGANNSHVPGYLLTFKVRDKGPYTTTVPRAGFTAQVAMAAMKEFAEHLTGLLDGDV